MLHPNSRFTNPDDVATSTAPIALVLFLDRAAQSNARSLAYGRVDLRTYYRRNEATMQSFEEAADAARVNRRR